ncbi:MAG: PepSY-associated TM helix domain-containing protein [Campylobacteraceae bacterium]
MKKGFWFKTHFIFGMVFGLLLVVIGFSGAMLSYRQDITQFLNKESFEVKEDTHSLTPEKLIERFLEQKPDAVINSVTISSSKTASATINTADPNGGRRGVVYYVNPYTAEILPNIKEGSFFMINLTLHRALSVGSMSVIGKNIVAISTIVLIVLSISGLILYWSRLKRNFFKSLKVDFKRNGYAFLYQLHSALGVWVFLLYIWMSLTGLYWSYGWYRTMLYSIAGVEQPVRGMMPPMQNQTQNSEQNQRGGLGFGNQTRGERAQGEGFARGMGQNQENIKQNKNQNNFQNLDNAFDFFKQSVNNDYSTVTLRNDTNGVYNFNYRDKEPAHSRANNQIEFNLNKQEIISNTKYNDKSLGEKLMSSMLPLHSGEYFGKVGLFLMFISSLILPLFMITGVMLFFKRYKKVK